MNRNFSNNLRSFLRNVTCLPSFPGGFIAGQWPRLIFFVVTAIVFSTPQEIQPSGPFSFLNYTTLRQGESFRILLRNSEGELVPSGEGRILILDRANLSLTFSLRAGGVPVEGTLKAKLKSDGNPLQIWLDSSGTVAGRKEGAREVVEADSFLAENGILTFQYLHGRRFLQLSVTRDGSSRMVTDWGAATLVRKGPGE